MKRKFFGVLAVALAVALGSVLAFAAAVPADVKGLDCETAVTKLVEENIITGDTDGLYHPNKNLTRAEVSTLIAKAVDPNAKDSEAIADYSDMAGYGWAAPFIGMMTEKGIAKGYPDGTFKPGANVKVCELAAFVIRACGVDEASLDGSWPDNYMKKADEMDLFDAVNGKDRTSGLDPNKPATKAQAAIAVYNALGQIRGDEESGWTFGKVTFSKDHKTMNDMELADGVKIYSYGKEKDYSETMTLPDVNKLEVQHPLKYAGAATNGFYKTANGKVTAAILPADQGASGRAYGFVTGSYWTVNTKGEPVFGVETMISGEEMEWTCTPDIKDLEDFVNMTKAGLEGRFIEFTITKGQVRAMSSNQSGFLLKIKELSAKAEGAVMENDPWAEVLEKHKTKPLFKLDNDPMDPYMAYADDVMVYVLNDAKDGWDVGSIDDVKKGRLVRCYDITDDKDDIANVIFVKRSEE